MVAQYCESSHPDCKPGETWKCWQEFTMRSRFRGKYLEVEPLGIAHLVFPKTGNHYTWRKGNKPYYTCQSFGIRFAHMIQNNIF